MTLWMSYPSHSCEHIQEERLARIQRYIPVLLLHSIIGAEHCIRTKRKQEVIHSVGKQTSLFILLQVFLMAPRNDFFNHLTNGLIFSWQFYRVTYIIGSGRLWTRFTERPGAAAGICFFSYIRCLDFYQNPSILPQIHEDYLSIWLLLSQLQSIILLHVFPLQEKRCKRTGFKLSVNSCRSQVLVVECFRVIVTCLADRTRNR